MANVFDRLVLYRMDKNNPLYVFAGFLTENRDDALCKKEKVSESEALLNIDTDESGNHGKALDTFFDSVNAMIEMAGKTGLRGNLFAALLTDYIVNNENAFSLECEMRGIGEGSLKNFAKNDFEIFHEAFHMDSDFLKPVLGNIYDDLFSYKGEDRENSIYNRRISESINDLAERLFSAAGPDEFTETVISFYKKYGVGTFCLHKAFRYDSREGIIPITKTNHVNLSDIIGYELQKKKLIENTESFINKRPANNCLLFGDAGTGKSTSVKALLNEYYSKGLRMIEVFKYQFKDLEMILDLLKGRNYRFIIYMDDLSFEEFETDYKYLKAIIEGGLEKKPDNVLIYATSNRRHLIRENYEDKLEGDDLHKSDTVQEKLSLSYRFGISIYYGSPDHSEFDKIVLGLRDRYGIQKSDDEILAEANRWELRSGGLSGRTARQFIDYLLGQEESL